MEQLKEIFEALRQVFVALVDLLEPLVRALAEGLFNADIQPGGAWTATALLLGSVIVYFIGSVLNWGGKTSDANQPMKITLTTAKTPAQVVGEARAKRIKELLILGAIFGVLVLMARGQL